MALNVKIKQIISQLKFKKRVLRNSHKGNSFVRIDASTICQLKCPICPTASGLNKKGIIGWGYLKFSDFKIFVDKNPATKEIELSNWGEIFLNPQIKELVRYAHEKKLALTASNGSNFNTLDEETIEYLVKYGFRFLSISIDGATNETYRVYRKGGNLDRVISNIKLLNYFKMKYNTEFPKLRWQFIIFGHNEHEIILAKQMAWELNMDFYLKLNYDTSFSPIKNIDSVKKVSGLKYISREDFRQKKNREYALPCTQFWLSPQINWDGKLLGCCMNIYSDFGNVFELGFENCLKSEKYVYTKEMLLGKVNARDDIPCTRCYIYLSSKGSIINVF